MRTIRYALIAIFAVALILVALANRGMVQVKLLPDEVATLAGMSRSVEMPLFLVIFGGIIAGLIIGFFWEWLREAKERAAAARTKREMQRLRDEVRRLKGEKHEGKDEVLAILDEAS